MTCIEIATPQDQVLFRQLIEDGQEFGFTVGRGVIWLNDQPYAVNSDDYGFLRVNIRATEERSS